MDSRNLDCVMGARGFDPLHGRIKIRGYHLATPHQETIREKASPAAGLVTESEYTATQPNESSKTAGLPGVARSSEARAFPYRLHPPGFG
jgi:hypothetical protein